MPIDSFFQIRAQVVRGDVAGGRDALYALLKSNPDLSEEPSFQALLGFALLRNDERDPGCELMSRARQTPPTDPSGLADLGGGLYLLGKFRKAHEFLTRAATMVGADATVFSRLALVELARGELEVAESHLQKAVELDPDHPGHWFNLANLHTNRGHFELALSHVREALQRDPAMDKARTLRNQLLVGLDQAAELIEELEAQLKEAPDSIDLRQQLAELLDADGRYPEALSHLREAMDRDPNNVALFLQMARLHSSRLRHRLAIKVLMQAEELEPDNPDIQAMLARNLTEAGDLERAADIAQELLSKNPQGYQALLTSALVRIAADDGIGAEEELRLAIELRPDGVEAYCNLAHLLIQNGRLDEAVTLYKKAAALNPTVLANLIEARSYPDDPRVVELMRKMADNPLLPKGPRIAMSFALTKLFDQQRDYERAFHYAGQANEFSGKTIVHRGNFHHRLVRLLEQHFTPEYHGRLRGVGSRSERPVFVVGMPRSGTTLTEQMLCTHPEVFGAGELGYIPTITRLMPKVVAKKVPYPFCLGGLQRWMLAHAASNYLQKIDKLDHTASRVVDKMPHNFLNLGLINLIFPRARIIHVQRDLRDVAISNYFTNFKHKHGGMSYAFDLKNIGRELNDYRLVMDHWREILPPGVMLEFHYEDLVEDPERIGRQLIEFIGLDWDPAMLDFHRTERPIKTASVWQVRQPLYKSSKERWRNYEQFLAPLDEILAEYPPLFG
ncbi:MAG: sulfotransferase [Proteobacteria bacterium]|nr:sulfotransferase [Pseudomonadota bacterium]MBU1689047.1 sulfotransferase [Pseudomonadota bacterium]